MTTKATYWQYAHDVVVKIAEAICRHCFDCRKDQNLKISHNSPP